MPKVAIESMRLCDVERVYEIMSRSGSQYLVVPENLEIFRDGFRRLEEERGARSRYEYVILWEGEPVGRIGLMIGHHSGELCYFVDANYRGKGIATEAVRLVEKIAFVKLGLDRIEILMDPENFSSERVAIKAGYEKEGVRHWAVKGGDEEYCDVLLYAKAKEVV